MYVVFSFILIVLFQNCSQGDGNRSLAYIAKPPPANIVIADEETADDIDGIPVNGGLGAVPPGTISGGAPLSSDPLNCFQNYISVFEWKNPTANLMNEKPVLGDLKIVTLKMNSNGFTSPIDAGWSIEGEIKIKTDSSSSSIRFLKELPDSSDSLDCYFMRVATGDTATLSNGKANVLLPNLGSNPATNTFSGFLRYSEQFIACKVTSSRKNIELKSSGESSTYLNYNQAFVIKRGCYQHPGQN